MQALALIELYNAPEGRYKQDVYLLPKKMGKDLPIALSCSLWHHPHPSSSSSILILILVAQGQWRCCWTLYFSRPKSGSWKRHGSHFDKFDISFFEF